VTAFEQDFANLINAGFPYVYIPTYEEERIVETIGRVNENPELIKAKRKIYVWTQTNGFVCGGARLKETMQPMAAIDFIAHNEENALFILKDFHVYFGGDRNARPEYALIRRLRDILPVLKSSRKCVIFISPHLIIPCDMEKEISVLEFALPSPEEIETVLDSLLAGLSPESIRLSAEEKQQLVRSALGLTLQEAENAFCRAIVHDKGISASALSIIHEEKNQVVRKTGVLEFVKSDLSIDDIGGLENLKKWLLRRNHTWNEKAKGYNIPAPKGVLITGVPGCGKSLTAKAMSAIWGLPLLKLDVGKIFGSLVGSSEENMRKAIATAEAISPSILWVDEIEKGFSGTRSDSDAGTSSRVFGTFLTWMQEKTAPVFVIATANDISVLPPELLRKGRFDEIFYVGLPETVAREEIFRIHLANRGVDLSDFDIPLLAGSTKGFSGAEIEQAVHSAAFEALADQRTLTQQDLMVMVSRTVPLSITMAEQIKKIETWAFKRAVPASGKFN
jgi:SpoVK/Ycf46/Vps4 family AAA+-type ATPase